MGTFRHWLNVLVCDEKKSFPPPSNTSTFSRHPRLLLLVLLSRTGRKGFKLLPSAEKDPPTQKKGPTMLSAIHAVVGTDGRTWMDALCFSPPPPLRGCVCLLWHPSRHRIKARRRRRD